MGPSVSMIVVSGDPDQTGTEFAIQFRTEGDIEVPPHWHPGDEHVTVLEGVFKLGFGRMFDLAVLQEIPIGSGAMFPPAFGILRAIREAPLFK